MSAELGYGQPMGGIAQTAFVVEDLGAAIDHWVTNCRAGPFFVLDHFLVPGQTYRGEESRADITIAMGFAGHMLMELIQPLDGEPSVYRETMELRGYGFHHLGIACADVDADSRPTKNAAIAQLNDRPPASSPICVPDSCRSGWTNGISTLSACRSKNTMPKLRLSSSTSSIW